MKTSNFIVLLILFCSLIIDLSQGEESPSNFIGNEVFSDTPVPSGSPYELSDEPGSPSPYLTPNISIATLSPPSSRIHGIPIPQVTFDAPRNAILFSEDDWSQDREHITVSISTQGYCSIKEFRAKIDIPKGWVVTPNPGPSELTYFIHDRIWEGKDLLNATSNKMYITDWLGIKPLPNILPGNYSLGINYSVEYGNFGSPRFVNGSEIIKLSMIKTKPDPNSIANYIPIIAVVVSIIATICGIIGLLFGTGLLREGFKKK